LFYVGIRWYTAVKDQLITANLEIGSRTD